MLSERDIQLILGASVADTSDLQYSRWGPRRSNHRWITIKSSKTYHDGNTRRSMIHAVGGLVLAASAIEKDGKSDRGPA